MKFKFYSAAFVNSKGGTQSWQAEVDFPSYEAASEFLEKHGSIKIEDLNAVFVPVALEEIEE